MRRYYIDGTSCQVPREAPADAALAIIYRMAPPFRESGAAPANPMARKDGQLFEREVMPNAGDSVVMAMTDAMVEAAEAGVEEIVVVSRNDKLRHAVALCQFRGSKVDWLHEIPSAGSEFQVTLDQSVVQQRPENTTVLEKIGGNGWVAQRGDGWATMSTPTGKWGNTDITFPITLHEFADLRVDPRRSMSIHEKYNAVRGDGWWARRDETCTVCLQDDRYGRQCWFHLPNEAFERLRDDPRLIASICDEYMEIGRFR